MEVAGANRRWRCPFRCRGSRRKSAVAQLFSLGHFTRHEDRNMKPLILNRRSKIVYGFSAIFFFCAIGFLIAGRTEAGSLLGIIGVSLAIGTATVDRKNR